MPPHDGRRRGGAAGGWAVRGVAVWGWGAAWGWAGWPAGGGGCGTPLRQESARQGRGHGVCDACALAPAYDSTLQASLNTYGRLGRGPLGAPRAVVMVRRVGPCADVPSSAPPPAPPLCLLGSGSRQRRKRLARGGRGGAREPACSWPPRPAARASRPPAPQALAGTEGVRPWAAAQPDKRSEEAQEALSLERPKVNYLALTCPGARRWPPRRCSHINWAHTLTAGWKGMHRLVCLPPPCWLAAGGGLAAALAGPAAPPPPPPCPRRRRCRRLSRRAWLTRGVSSRDCSTQMKGWRGCQVLPGQGECADGGAGGGGARGRGNHAVSNTGLGAGGRPAASGACKRIDQRSYLTGRHMHTAGERGASLLKSLAPPRRPARQSAAACPALGEPGGR